MQGLARRADPQTADSQSRCRHVVSTKLKCQPSSETSDSIYIYIYTLLVSVSSLIILIEYAMSSTRLDSSSIVDFVRLLVSLSVLEEPPRGETTHPSKRVEYRIRCCGCSTWGSTVKAAFDFREFRVNQNSSCFAIVQPATQSDIGLKAMTTPS